MVKTWTHGIDMDSWYGHGFMLSTWTHGIDRDSWYRDGKRASNACVNEFIVWVKSVTNSMLFCHKSELCCDFVLFEVILMSLVFFYFYLQKRIFLYLCCVADLFCSELLSNTFHAVLLQTHFCCHLRTYFG